MKIIDIYKQKKLEKQPINIVVNSTYDYNNHDMNILKACLNVWSSEYDPRTSIKFTWMYANPNLKEKIYFISTNLKELKQYKLEGILNIKNIQAETFMNSEFASVLFSPYETMTKQSKQVA